MRPPLKTDDAAPLRNARRVLIVRLRSLGDCVLSTPAIHLLKLTRPDVEIGVVAEPVWQPVFEGNPDVSVILPPSHRATRNFNADVVIDFHGGNTAARVTFFSGARYRAGFAHFKRAAAYNVRIPRAQEILGEERVVHTAEHMASAIFFLGIDRKPIPRAQLYALPASQKHPPYAVLHPVAATPEKTWAANGFVRVAEHLQRQHGLEPVFIAAAGQDLSPFSRFKSISGASLRDIKSLISGATLFVGNDSGPAHIAAGFGVPPVVIFGPSDPAIWGPWRTQGEVLQSEGAISSIDPACVIAAIDHLRVTA
jgi:ADP-heptose:LPS heptosyltransferase